MRNVYKELVQSGSIVIFWHGIYLHDSFWWFARSFNL